MFWDNTLIILRNSKNNLLCNRIFIDVIDKILFKLKNKFCREMKFPESTAVQNPPELKEGKRKRDWIRNNEIKPIEGQYSNPHSQPNQIGLYDVVSTSRALGRSLIPLLIPIFSDGLRLPHLPSQIPLSPNCPFVSSHFRCMALLLPFSVSDLISNPLFASKFGLFIYLFFIFCSCLWFDCFLFGLWESK